jgi:hypothetical protein
VRLKGLGQLKTQMPSGFEPAVLRLVAYRLNQLRHRVPSGFENKTEICIAFLEVQLPGSTVTRRVECMTDDTVQELMQNLEICCFLALS